VSIKRRYTTIVHHYLLQDGDNFGSTKTWLVTAELVESFTSLSNQKVRVTKVEPDI